MNEDVITLASGVCRLVPGNPAARRVALLSRYGQSRMKGVLNVAVVVFAAVVVFRLSDDPFTVTLASGWYTMITAGWAGGTDRAQGAEDYALTLPVSREELFWTRFLTGLFVTMALPVFAVSANALEIAPALWSLFVEGPMVAPVPAWPAVAFAAALGIPAVIYAGGFLVHTLPFGIIGRMIFTMVGIWTMTGLAFFAGSSEFSQKVAGWIPGVLFIVLFAAFSATARVMFLRIQVLPGIDAKETTRKPARIAGRSKNKGASPAVAVTTTPVTFTSSFGEKITPEAARRRALLRHTFGRRQTGIRWGLGFCAASALVAPAGGLWLVQAGLMSMLVSWIYTGWNRGSDAEEFSLLLPVGRAELFYARVAPVFTTLAALAIWSVTVTCLIGVPNALWGFAKTPDIKSAVAVALAPVTSVILFVILPMGAPLAAALFGFIGLAFQLGGVKFLMDCDAGELALTLIGTSAVALAWAYRSFLTKEVNRPVVRQGLWGGR